MVLIPVHSCVIDEKGTSLAYLDSGAIDGPYSTLVVVHGHTYHAQGFKKIISRASEYNLRIIAIYRRDYAPSSPFTYQELADLSSDDDAKHKVFQQARGLEIAKFLFYVINDLKIHPPSDDGKTGGLGLLGWSAGNLTTLAFLRNADTYPPDILTVVEKYLSGIILYEASLHGIGQVRPPNSYHPLMDPSIPPRQKGIIFGFWISSYFEHPSPESRSLDGLQLRIPAKPLRPATNELMEPDELIGCIDVVAAKRSEDQYIHNVRRETLHDQYTGALFNANFFPKLKVTAVYGSQTVWSCIWAIWMLEDDIKKREQEGELQRPISIRCVEGGNHFIHWDLPEAALSVFGDAIVN